MKQPLSEKLFLQKNIASNINVEICKLKNKKNHCIKLQPLDAKAENNVHNPVERKFSHQLNPIPSKCPGRSDQKRLCSKIPILQRKTLNSPKNTTEGNYDATLSAADRRQKFHQSRLCLPALPQNDRVSVISDEKKYSCQNKLNWNENYAFPNVCIHPGSAVTPKHVLPPIKPIDVITTTVQKVNQSKSKCLLGEITHFPALCNPQCLKQQNKQKSVSTIPHLPPIFSLPLAPPPSISASLEQESKECIRNEKKIKEWKPCKPTIIHRVFAF